MATKINSIRSKVLPDGVMIASWLGQMGISRSDLSEYVKRDTLNRVATGVYRYPGTAQTVYGILSSYQTQVCLNYHIGASTALEIKGYNHYIAMGKPKVVVFTPKAKHLPKWIAKGNFDMDIVELSTITFGDTGIETVSYNGYTLAVSSPERAIMECILLSPQYYNLMDTYYIMEMLTTMRSSLVQMLLEQCSSVKVKRLFLYMAEKSGHRWFSKLNLDRITLGSGTRAFIKGGIKNARYDIMLPTELANYEGNI